jgi:hypothetical protein
MLAKAKTGETVGFVGIVFGKESNMSVTSGWWRVREASWALQKLLKDLLEKY